MSTDALRITGLSHSFGSVKALSDVSLTVPRGSFTALLGVNGAGKTTLFSLVTRLYSNVTGSIEVAGHDVRRQPAQAMARLGVVFQSRALDADLSVAQNLAYHAALHGIGRSMARARITEVLAQVGLAGSVGDLSPSELSGGMQKRVALARTIASQPAILFFDEPTTGLDPIMGAVIDGLIVDCVKRLGATAITITHDMHSARRIGDQASMIYQGRMVWTGPAATLGETGNAMVDQFARGEREGPIKMELRR